MTETHTVTVLGTTDLHGRVLDWDYHHDGPYRDDWGNVTGLARVASVVRRVRAESRSPILIDNGDFLQGTPLVSHAADGLLTGRTHPMAVAMNALGFDAAVTGNHEFDYGLDVLRAFESDAEFPLLGGNVIDRATGDSAFAPSMMREVDVPDGRPVRVAIIGLAHPGTGVWNRMQVGETLRFDGLVGAAQRWVDRVREHGADVVVVAAHCGVTEGEIGARHVYEGVDRVAERVPGVDAILAGHTHREVECQRFVNAETGQQTIMTMPMCWGMRVAAIDITVVRAGDEYRVVERNARLIDTSEADEDPEIVRLAEHDHRAVIDAGRTHVGTSSAAFEWCGAAWRPVPIVSLIQHAQAAAVADSVGALPVISVAAVPHYAAAIPRGDVPRRAVETIASFESRTVAVVLSGADLREHLETAARYFATPVSGGPVSARHIVNAPSPLHPAGTPDFAYDSMLGYSGPLRYEIDLARPGGDRIRSLTYDGAPITDEMEFAAAMSSYRRTGADGYTCAADAPLLYECELDARTMLLDWIGSNSPLTPESFHYDSWRLTYDGVALEIVEGEVHP